MLLWPRAPWAGTASTTLPTHILTGPPEPPPGAFVAWSLPLVTSSFFGS